MVAACVCRKFRHVVSVRRLGAGGVLQRLEDPADRRRADPVAYLEQLALDPLCPQPLFSVASRSMSAGRPRGRPATRPHAKIRAKPSSRSAHRYGTGKYSAA